MGEHQAPEKQMCGHTSLLDIRGHDAEKVGRERSKDVADAEGETSGI